MSKDIDKAVPGFMAGTILTAAFSTAFPVVLIGAVTGAIISYNLDEKDNDNNSNN